MNDFLAENFPEFYESLGKFVFDTVETVSWLYDTSVDYWSDALISWDPLGIMPEVNNDFNSANAFVERRDPLSLDLDGDGIETVGTNAGITFDFDGDGLKTGTGWVKGDDGFLVLDRNGNGQIDNGGELFGVDTVKTNGQKASNGFDALKDFDSNGDGVFDAQDTQFANVKIWQDANQDGIAQAGELKTLAEHNIVAINLDSTASNHNSNGNLISAVGSFVRGDGSEGTVNANQSLAANLDLASNPFYREFTDHIALDDTAKALPDMKGSGAVRDLREASMLNAELKTLLATYSQAQTREEQMGLLDQLIAEWAKSADYQTFDERIDALDDGTTDVRFQYSWEASGTQPTEAQQNTRKLLERVKALEVFNAQNILKFGKVGSDASSLTLSFGIGANTGNSTYSTSQGVVVIDESRLGFNATQTSLLDQAYEKLKQSILDGLALQTTLKPYVDLIDVNLTTSGLKLDYTKTFELLNTTAASNPLKAISDALDFTRIWQDKSATYSVISNLLPNLVEQLSTTDLQHVKSLYASTGLHLQFGDASRNALSGTNNSDLIYAGNGDDTIVGNGGNDTLIGGAGNDSLTAFKEDDLLIGGKGNDTLDGHEGSDTYVFDLGDGQDVIVDTSVGWGLPSVDVIRFGEGINRSDLSLSRSGGNLIIRYGANDQVTITNQYTGYGNRIEFIEFANGDRMDIKALEIKLGVQGTDGDDAFGTLGNDPVHFKGGLGNDTLRGGASSDILNGEGGNDSIVGNGGNDTLIGGAGDDVLTAYKEDDLLIGGKGNDTLDGHEGSDTYVFDLGDGQDVIVDTSVGWGLPSVDVIRFGEGINRSDLSLSRSGGNLIIRYGANDQVTITNQYTGYGNRIEFIEFANGDRMDIKALEIKLGVQGTDGDDAFGTLGNDPVHFKGGLGNDTLRGGASSDILNGEGGNDSIVGNGGNDTLIGGAGDDVLTAYKEDDLLIGGKGNDTLDGHEGSDTYVFDLGDGQDVIVDTSVGWGLPSVDVIRFGEGINRSDLSLSRSGGNLIIRYGANDQVTITNQYTGYGNRIEFIEFANGVRMDIKALEMELGVQGTDGDDAFGTLGNDPVHFKGGLGNDTLRGGASSDILNGEGGNDSIVGNGGNDTLIGGAGDDVLTAYKEDDLLIGGKGNDTLDGHEGSDTYVFDLGDGQDVIVDTSVGWGLPSVDVIRFGEGIHPSDLSLSRSGGNLIIRYGAEDQITIINQYSGYANQIEFIEFADGTRMGFKALELELGVQGSVGDDGFEGYGNDAVHFKGMAGNDVLNGAAGNDILDGGDDNDSLNGGAGNDTLFGGAGNDSILGGYGDDLLVGGKGNDILNGHDGSDTYVFNLGDGQDTLDETYESTADNYLYTDIIRFGEGINVADMRMSREGRSLTLHYSATDSITLPHWYTNPYVRIEKVEFADGSSCTINSLEMELGVTGTAGDDGFGIYGNDAMHFKGLAGNDVLNGAAGNDILDGGDGNDSLNGGAGDDNLFGGAGDDSIHGGYGDDLLVGGKGNDTLDGHEGSDTYVFSLGDGQDTLAETYVNTTDNYLATDVIRFGEGISVSDMRMSREGSNLTLHYSATDSITIPLWYRNPYMRIEKIEFADGSSRTINSLEMELGVTGTAGDDGFGGYSNDAVHFKGLAGNDVLNGAAGNDILDGGEGNDTVNGGYGNDTYLFAKGDGQDLVADVDGNDTLLFGEGISANDIWLQRNGSNLELTLRDSTDKVTISNWYSSTSNHIETIKSGDGKTLLDSQVQNLVNAMAAFAPPAGGSSNLTPEQRAQLEVVIAANWQ